MNKPNFPSAASCATYPKYVCASERVKLIGTTNARFPDFGHHLEKEMGGLWLHPIKLLDGFWLRLHDESADNVNVWLIADGYKIEPWGNTFYFGSNLGHTTMAVTQRQLCPDEAAGLLVEYTLHNQGKKPCPLKLEWLARTDLRPVWFSETEGITSGGRDKAEWLAEDGLVLVKDPENSWFAAVGCSSDKGNWELHDRFGPEINEGDGVSLSFFHSVTLAPGAQYTLRFYVAGSYTSQEDCLAQYARLAGEENFLAAKQARYSTLLERAAVETPDARFNEIYNWIKIHNDWLTMDAGKYGRGLAAGLPEYPWWFGCDNCYSLQGVLAMGDYALARDTLQLILEYSMRHNGNGRILHEVTTGGICANPGNTQETAHFIVMLWLYYEWTGDFSLVEQAFAYLEKSVEWLRGQDPEGELFPGGYGIIEIAGLNSKMIDTAVYTAAAYDCYSRICRLMGRQAQADEYGALAAAAADALNTQMWDDEQGLYCDAFTNVSEVLEKKAAILEKRHGKNAGRAEQILNETIEKKSRKGAGKSGWLLNHNWVINTPMEMGLAPRDKAARALEKLHTPDYIGPYGMYLSGVTQDATMTISTGAMAVAQARYGYTSRALELLQRMFSTFGMASPGCLAEMSPDYGCFVQGWTVYATTVPVVRYFFGIQPEALPEGGHRLILRPVPPCEWDTAALRDTPVLDGQLSLTWQRDGRSILYSGCYTGTAPVQFALLPGQRATLNGTLYTAGGEEAYIELPGDAFTLRVEK